MTLFEIRVFIFCLFMMALSACVSQEQRAEEKREISRIDRKFADSSAEARYAALDAGADSFLQVSFKPGTADLAGDGKNQIRGWLKKNTQRGKLERVQVVAWADQEYPTSEERKLADDQVRLAQARADRLRDLVRQEASGTSVKAYSMAERLKPSEEWYKLSEGALKKSLERSGIAVGDHADRASAGSAQKGHALLLLQVER